jgi:hypothetical protein
VVLELLGAGLLVSVAALAGMELAIFCCHAAHANFMYIVLLLLGKGGLMIVTVLAGSCLARVGIQQSFHLKLAVQQLRVPVSLCACLILSH